MCRNTGIWSTDHTLRYFSILMSHSWIPVVNWDILVTFSEHFLNGICRDSLWQRWTNTGLRTVNLSAVKGKNRKVTAFLLGGNQRKTKHEQKNVRHTLCLRKQHAFELLSIFQNKSRVLCWIIKEHRAISVFPLCSSVALTCCCNSKLQHFSTSSYVLGMCLFEFFSFGCSVVYITCDI